MTFKMLHVHRDRYDFTFFCDWPDCKENITLPGLRYYDDDDIEDLAKNARHLEAKHGEWGLRNTRGFYCVKHMRIISKIMRIRTLRREIARLEEESDEFEFELRSKNIFEDDIERVLEYERHSF